MPERTLRVCALYPDLMNIYADRGNLLLLERRCAWRGIGFEVTAAGLGDEIDPDAHDLFYLGGGQDRDQLLVRARPRRGQARRAARGGGARRGRPRRLRRLPAARPLLRARRRGDRRHRPARPRDRARGRPAPDRQRRDRGRPARRRPAARASSPASRTTAAAPTSGRREQPLGRVLRGHGNDGALGLRGRAATAT